MPEQELEALYEQYPAVIAQMEETFTSHDFILRLAQQNQLEYIKALHRYRNATYRGAHAPFMRVHGILAKHLHDYPELIELVHHNVPSTDIFGRPATCAGWRKIAAEERRAKGTHRPIDQRYAWLFQRVDDAVARIQQFQVEPDLSRAIMERTNRTPDFDLGDDDILKRLILLIAYSNNARADAVRRIVHSGIFDRIFQGYDPQAVANLNSSDVVQAYWAQIKGIRFKNKVDRMIDCARCVRDVQARHGSFMQYLKIQDIPISIQTMADLDEFWSKFDIVIADFKAMGMPYLRNLTSSCHLLLELGYDCAKPDSGVMKAAARLQIVPPPEKTRTFSNEQRKKVIQFMQMYAMHRGIRVAVVDLYFLIYAGQTGAVKFVQSAYYA